MEAKIIRAGREHLEKIQELNNELFGYEADLEKTLNLDWTFSDEAKNGFPIGLKVRRGYVFIALSGEGEEVIGFITGYMPARENWREKSAICELENIFVKEEFRGAGIGRMLYQELLLRCKRKGAERIIVRVISKNASFMEFYKSVEMREFIKIMETDI